MMRLGLSVVALTILRSSWGATPEGYIGARQCGTCHPKQFASQSKSHHALALRPGSEVKQFSYLPEGRTVNGGVAYDFEKSDQDYRVAITLRNEKAEFVIDWIVGANDQGLT